MRREILQHKRMKIISGCCPGHDDWPRETYRGKRSKHARSRDIKKEHRYARRKTKQLTRKESHAQQVPIPDQT
jgi:hypothetical protein